MRSRHRQQQRNKNCALYHDWSLYDFEIAFVLFFFFLSFSSVFISFLSFFLCETLFFLFYFFSLLNFLFFYAFFDQILNVALFYTFELFLLWKKKLNQQVRVEEFPFSKTSKKKENIAIIGLTLNHIHHRLKGFLFSTAPLDIDRSLTDCLLAIFYSFPFFSLSI